MVPSNASDDAMQSLRAMFSNLDEETIGFALAANDGNIEQATEQLLAASIASEESSSRCNIPITPQTFIQMDRPSDIDELLQAGGRTGSWDTFKLRGKIVKLPANFLRVPSYGGYAGVRSTEQAQVAADERLAAVLQNSDFLAAHPEYAKYTDNDTAYNNTSHPDDYSMFSANSLATITDQIQNMGVDMKKKLQNVAARWNSKTANSATRKEDDIPLMENDEAEVVSFDQSDLPTRRASSRFGLGNVETHSRTSSQKNDDLINLSESTVGSKKDM